MEKKPVNLLIDTDIGGDVDDALALALALNSPEINIVGITAVYLANEWRANVTRNMLKVFGREDIPVSTGAEKPLIGWWDESRIPNSSKDFGILDGKPLPCACDFIIETVKKYGALTIAAIGPLTNVALAIAKAPYIVPDIKIIMMGGQITKAHPEWNIVCDPEAARIVFESGASIVMTGLDVTNRCTFTREDIEYVKQAGNERSTLLGEMLDTFCVNFGYLPILHDPLALSCLIWDDLITFEDKKILIETSGQYTRGLTIDCDWGEGNPVKAAVDVKPEEFKKRLLERIVR
ncbi:inosine-uridine nucleoside N-ribohydrolase [Anaerotaenia torta]|uniref:nucleoside hydrolase n=1 Tax=Anaerotaenia torta TaxID=433293 RepID=UPI003D21487A